MIGMLGRIGLLMCLSIGIAFGSVDQALAGRDDNQYDGNIYALYAGNGSLVPPASSLADARAAGRTAVLVYYLDDSADCKRFAPVVSELQRLWSRSIDLLPLTIDPLQGRMAEGPNDPASYWSGRVPQVVVLSPEGRVVLDRAGQVALDVINEAISEATGIPAPDSRLVNPGGTFNEVNIEVEDTPG